MIFWLFFLRSRWWLVPPRGLCCVLFLGLAFLDLDTDLRLGPPSLILAFVPVMKSHDTQIRFIYPA